MDAIVKRLMENHRVDESLSVKVKPGSSEAYKLLDLIQTIVSQETTKVSSGDAEIDDVNLKHWNNGVKFMCKVYSFEAPEGKPIYRKLDNKSINKLEYNIKASLERSFPDVDITVEIYGQELEVTLEEDN